MVSVLCNGSNCDSEDAVFQNNHQDVVTVSFASQTLRGSHVRGHLHISQHGVITGDLGEVGFQDGHGAGESHVATSTEQGNAREAEDCSHQRRVWHPA